MATRRSYSSINMCQFGLVQHIAQLLRPFKVDVQDPHNLAHTTSVCHAYSTQASGARKERHSSPMLYLLHREPRLQMRVVQRIVGSQQHLLRRLVQVVHHKVPLWRPQRHNGSVELLSFSLTPSCAPCLLALCCSLASSVTQSHVLMVLQPGLVVPVQQRGGEARTQELENTVR